VTYALELDGVSKRFGATTAVDGLELRLSPGAFVGLLGRNGAGKTTTGVVEMAQRFEALAPPSFVGRSEFSGSSAPIYYLEERAHIGGEAMKPEQVLQSDLEVMGGTPVFTGTRVPVQTLIDYLKAGDTLEDFLDGFPSVRRRQAEAFLEIALESAIARNARAA
jgi:uncharacterized protein (DUF433 family)